MSDVEKQQAKMRLVRLDAEGNPVGVGEEFNLRRFDLLYTEPFPQDPHPMDVRILETLKRKRVTLKGIEISEETARLLRGESGDSDPARDSGADTAGSQ